MSASTWRNVAIALAVMCSWMWWSGGCRRRAPISKPTLAQCKQVVTADGVPVARLDHESADDESAPARAARDGGGGGQGGFAIGGFTAPAWIGWLAPHPGEDMLAYRDRMVPLAQAAVAPHRARVARSRDNLAQLIGLDGRQRAELDGAVEEAATAIQDRLLNSFLSGDFSPSTFKPMVAVDAAKDVLDAVARGNRRFLSSLNDGQRATLLEHPFDFADYMLFSHRWEEILGK